MEIIKNITTSDYKYDDETIASLFGHEAAEREDPARLKKYFIKKSDYESVCSDLPLKIVIGFKGVGKSAVLKVSYLEDTEKGIPTIWIRPDDISELYEELLKESNTLKLITLWKKGISRLIACRIAEKLTISTSEDSEKAIRWAEETGYRSRDLISQLAQKFKPLVKDFLDVDDSRSNQNTGEHHILERLLRRKKIRVYMDDLDRGWEATNSDIKRLSALINALGDLTSDIQGLQVRISLRGDVYSLIRGSSEFTDKFESSEIWCKWTNHEILLALIKRIYTFFDIKISETALSKMHQSDLSKYLSPLFAQRFEGTKCWNNAPIYRVIMSLIRRRPRDMVKLCTASAKQAYDENSNTILGKHMLAILENYSIQRMKDIIIEFKSELPNIDDLLYNMGPTTNEIREKHQDRYLYTTDKLFQKIKNVMENVPVKFNNPSTYSFHDVAHFLYKIGFITATRVLDDGYVERKYFEERPQLLSKSFGDGGYSWEIHPAYRSALFKKTCIDDLWEFSIKPDKELDS